MYATKPGMAREFSNATPSIKALPEKVSKYKRVLNRGKVGHSGSSTPFGGTGGGGGMGTGGGMTGS
jgi:hypothetical protein